MFFRVPAEFVHGAWGIAHDKRDRIQPGILLVNYAGILTCPLVFLHGVV